MGSINFISLKNFAISFCFLILFSTAAFSKLQSLKTPEWFLKQFQNSLFAAVPGGVQFSYWLIALVESALAVSFLISFFYLPILPLALVGSILLFGMLCFGLRIIYDFQGSANMFIYIAAALISLISLGIAGA